MENAAVIRFMRLITPLSAETKLEILSRLSENLKSSFRNQEGRIHDKEYLFTKLSGAWSELDDKLSEEILNARTISDRNVGFD